MRMVIIVIMLLRIQVIIIMVKIAEILVKIAVIMVKIVIIMVNIVLMVKIDILPKIVIMVIRLRSPEDIRGSIDLGFCFFFSLEAVSAEKCRGVGEVSPPRFGFWGLGLGV